LLPSGAERNSLGHLVVAVSHENVLILNPLYRNSVSCSSWPNYLFCLLCRQQDAELISASWNKPHSDSGLGGFSPEDDLVKSADLQ